MLADRKTGKVVDTIYEAKPFFCYHHANAFEKDGHVVMDLCTYDDPAVSIWYQHEMEHLRVSYKYFLGHKGTHGEKLETEQALPSSTVYSLRTAATGNPAFSSSRDPIN